MQRTNRLADFLSRIAILVIVLIGVVGVFGWYLPLIKENQTLRKEIALQKETVAELSEEYQDKQNKLHSFQHDPRSAERLARENLGYSREGETVFRFESAPQKSRTPAEGVRGR